MSSSPIFLSYFEILHAVPLTVYHEISKGKLTSLLNKNAKKHCVAPHFSEFVLAQ